MKSAKKYGIKKSLHNAHNNLNNALDWVEACKDISIRDPKDISLVIQQLYNTNYKINKAIERIEINKNQKIREKLQ